jgi:Flp pilus assembly protein TadD
VVLVFTALALAAKPMAVTLPLTLVLLDVWPLRARPEGRGSLVLRYARELAPPLAFAAVCGVLTLAAQRHGHALQSVTSYPWPVRMGNALVAYVWYLKTAIWPAGLAAFYPHPMATIASVQVATSALALLAISTIVVVVSRSVSAVAMGWWWYVGTLLPVAGIIQVGSQAYADRYAYVPLIGIFVIAAWSAVRLTDTARPFWRRAAAGAGAACIVALSLSTHAQLPFWHDSVSLFQRAVEVVPENALAHNNLGMALVARNEIAQALGHFQKAAEIAPWDTDARSNVGNALRALGRPAEAAVAYAQALEQAPDDPTVHYNLATALIDLGRGDEAAAHLDDAVRLDPGYVKARFLLGTLLVQQGRASDALIQFREVARLDPGDARAREWVRRLEAQGAL